MLECLVLEFFQLEQLRHADSIRWQVGQKRGVAVGSVSQSLAYVTNATK